jgi:hypothetical protein
MKLISTITLSFILSGCASYHSIDRLADGRITSTTIIELGRSEAITAFSDTTQKDGRSISVGGTKGDVNVPALQAGTGAIGAIIGDALKAYTGKP